MRFVLDASVALKWVLPEADSPKAIRLRDEFRNQTHELLAPDIFPIELVHGLTRAERQGRIAIGDSGLHLADLLATLPDLHPCLPLLLRACELSSLLRIGAYDCLYVALAEREGCELVTADDRLVKTLAASFPFVVSLASMP